MPSENINVLKVKDLMQVLNIGRDKAYSLMRSKAFPSIRIGRSYFVTEEELNSWLKGNRYKTYAI